VRFEEESSEFAVNDSNDEQDQDGDDGNRDDAVRSHPTKKNLVSNLFWGEDLKGHPSILHINRSLHDG
jgi:hypothetical protein